MVVRQAEFSRVIIDKLLLLIATLALIQTQVVHSYVQLKTNCHDGVVKREQIDREVLLCDRE